MPTSCLRSSLRPIYATLWQNRCLRCKPHNASVSAFVCTFTACQSLS